MKYKTDKYNLGWSGCCEGPWCPSDLPCELPITSWDYTGKPYEHMYLSSAVGRDLHSFTFQLNLSCV